MRRTLASAGLTGIVLCGLAVAPQGVHASPWEDRSMYAAADYSQELKAFIDSGKSEDQAIEAAKAIVVHDFKDPESARFRKIELRDFQGGKLVCGEVNGKNSYGAYVGYRKFLASNLHMMLRGASDIGKFKSEGRLTALDYACGSAIQESNEIDTNRCPPDVIERLRDGGASDESLLFTCGRRD